MTSCTVAFSSLSGSVSPARDVTGSGVFYSPENVGQDAGFGLIQLESELERQLRTEQQARLAVEAENKLLKGLLVGRAA